MEFHLIKNGKQEGPFTVEELSQQGITPESEVWAPGMADWMQAGDVPELTAVLQRAEFEAAQQAARAAQNQPAMGQPYEPAVNPGQVPPPVPPRVPVQDETKKKSGCTPWLIAALILAIMFATMVFTCPDRSAHEAAIQEVTKAWVRDKVDDNLGGITGIGGVFGDLINKAIMELTGTGTDKIVSSYLDVKNYVICSVGNVTLGENESKMVSLGVFGHVFTFGKEDIEKAWTRAMDDYEANHHITPAPPVQQQDDESDAPQDEQEDVMPDPRMLPDSVMGIEVPKGMDSMVNQMANEAMKMAKEWAKQQIDKLGK
ncbi:MAG: GYF domain-containing protein [Bacteroidales bacterium]|nr:GYF domain-containing protein [Bacteroidales bacterium]